MCPLAHHCPFPTCLQQCLSTAHCPHHPPLSLLILGQANSRKLPSLLLASMSTQCAQPLLLLTTTTALITRRPPSARPQQQHLEHVVLLMPVALPGPRPTAEPGLLLPVALLRQRTKLGLFLPMAHPSPRSSPELGPTPSQAAKLQLHPLPAGQSHCLQRAGLLWAPSRKVRSQGSLIIGGPV